ncbi:hypothetical protein BKP56_06845 [Marinilactibacillus sp. 15R]|uniref:hypothetical protein n=1 Tax=Marinilactibacillus sp. 15R TaxID=1911586 RepID=UPI00090B146E|nr:hypothetical protein [Marinilactibacillus sp. 15R]API88988.1 hypothetical protein BKP56_06845 [Marinilactibacillus sp. 15R]
MGVKIRRKTGFIGTATKLSIKVDGEKVDKIIPNESKEIKLPKNRATIQIKHFGMKSNKLEVKDGQQLEITIKEWAKYAMFLPVILSPLVESFIDSSYRLLPTILTFSIFIAILNIADE